MVKAIWKKILKTKGFLNKKPIFCLAPMADVTDKPFRTMIAKYGKPDVIWTEFVSADGLSSKDGKKNLLKNLEFSKKEKPIIAQIFGSRPDNIEKACKIIAKLGFDGIDINMGCPDRKVEKQGAGAALIKNPKLAREIIKSAIKGAGKIPVSVKTRIGYSKVDYKTWLKEILLEDMSALTIHLRTRKEMSEVSAHWELAKEIVDYVKTINKDVVLIANGDIKSKKEGIEKALDSGFDGVMIGRGFFGKPWLLHVEDEVPVDKKLKTMLEHTKLFERIMGKHNANKRHKNFSVMKKHFKAYVSDFPLAKELRNKLMETESYSEVKTIIDSWTV